MKKNSRLLRPPLLPFAWSGADQRWMLSKFASAVLLALVLEVVVLTYVYVIGDLYNANQRAQKIYEFSVLGLHRIGDLQYAAQETRRSTFYALSTVDSNLQVRYADQSREADHQVTQGIAEYLKSAATPTQIDAGKRLEKDWAAYLDVRDNVLSSILEGSAKEAVDLDLSRGVPFFDRVRQDLQDIDRLYDEQASLDLANVAAASRRTILRVLAVLGFTLIFTSGAFWVIQRNRMQGAIQFAALQMDFVASISHELRTPLAVISSAADNIADGLVAGKEDLRRYGTAIRNQSRQMAQLVDQILLFSATKDKKYPYQKRSLQVSEIIDSALDNASELVRSAGFTIDRQVSRDLPAISGDLVALSQCVQNLVTNAVKYSGSSRWIGIAAFLYDLDDHGSKREMRIAVRDKGIGIPHAELPLIFEPFYRSPSVEKERIHGTGLGLSISKSIAEAMGGSLTVTSEPSVGTEFILHLPILSQEESNATRDSRLPEMSQR